MVYEDIKKAMTEALREVLPQLLAELSTGKGLNFKNRGADEKNPDLSTTPEPRVECVMGQLLVPEAIRAKWAARFPGIDLEKEFLDAARRLSSGRGRPPTRGLAYWVEQRLRLQYQRAAIAAQKGGAAPRLAPQCDWQVDGERCLARSILSRMVDGARTNLCEACVVRATDARWRARAAAKG